MKTYKPFTYRIGWSNANLNYYGARYAKNAHPSELWSTYFTSSKTVMKLRKEFGEPDIIEVRKVFETKEDTVAWEHKVLLRLKVNISTKWVNQCIAPGLGVVAPWNLGIKGLKTNYPKNRKPSGPISEEKRVKLRNAAIKQWANKSEEEILQIKQKMSENKVNKTPWNKGKTGLQTAWNKGKKMQEWECEYCGKQGRGKSTYNRWHGENCRNKK